MSELTVPQRFDVGSRVRWPVTFRVAGVLTDPTTITAKYQKPDGTEVSKIYGTDVEVVKVSAGEYYIDIDVTAAGTWYARWNGTGACVAAIERSFVAKSTQF